MKFQNGVNQKAHIQINLMLMNVIECKKKKQTKKFSKVKENLNNKDKI
jgi:hypothetical protein